MSFGTRPALSSILTNVSIPSFAQKSEMFSGENKKIKGLTVKDQIREK